MSPEEVIGKFVSFQLMIKDSIHIVNLEQGATSTLEVQPVSFKATEEKKEESTPTSRLPIDFSKLDNEGKSSNKGRGRTTNPAPRGFATGVVSPIILLLNVHIQVIVTGTTIRKVRRRWRRRDTTRRRVARHT
jgi:hypothetical protein